MPTVQSPFTALEESADLQGLTPDQLADASSNPEMLEAVRSEVCRRLKDDLRKANFLTFRYLFPANDTDKYDAFNGLGKTCWRAAKARHVIDWRYANDGRQYTADFEKASSCLDAELLIPYLDDLSQRLEPPEIIRMALNAEFQTDVDVANAFRKKVRDEREIISLEKALEEEQEKERTLLEVLADDSGSGSNPYSDAVELITIERAEIVEVLGERGWEVLLEFVELVDSDSLPVQERARERVLTDAIGTKCGVKERQARIYKKRFRAAFWDAVEAGNPVFERIAELLGWNGELPEEPDGGPAVKPLRLVMVNIKRKLAKRNR